MVPDELIMALADGELQGREAARVDAAVRSNDALRRKHEMFRRTRTLLSRAFDGVLDEPLPERLRTSVHRPPH